MQESSEREIPLKGHGGGLTVAVFKPILSYIYSGEMDMNSKDNDLIKAIWVEATFFGLLELADKAINHLHYKSSSERGDNRFAWAFDVLPLAHDHQNSDLKNECIRELEAEPEASIQCRNEINKLPGDLFKELISRDTFWPDETVIYEAVQHWLTANQPAEGVSEKEKEEFLQVKAGLLDEIRIQHIPADILFNDETMLANFGPVRITEAMKTKHCTQIKDKKLRGLRSN